MSGNSGHITTYKRYGFSMDTFNKMNAGCFTLKKGPSLLSVTKERVSAFFQGKAPLVVSPGKFNYIIRVLEGMGETTLKRWLEEHLRGCELEVQISRDTLLSAGSFIKRANQNPVIISTTIERCPSATDASSKVASNWPGLSTSHQEYCVCRVGLGA